ncbi:MAG: serine/threonine protein kinase [Archangium sp.]|nr:serine/threonine protein kinase [Archangium sp.]
MSDTLPIAPVSQPLQLKDPLVGTRLGDYEVIEPIGEGGMGVVYRAVHPLIKKRVAIKVLKPGAATDAGHVKRLLAEAEAVNSIGHRHIIDIFGLGQLDDGRPYIVMELLDGEPLDAYLRRNPKLPLHEVLALLVDIASPLAAAHAKGVIHRDLKPSNVFICREADGGHYLKLLDFGLAKKAMGMDGSSAQTSQHVVAGTPDYMAPEQARAMPVSARTDLYAFGSMAYEMLTGEVPYVGQTPMDVMMAHVSAPVPSVSALMPTVPPELDGLVRRLMAKDAAERPASMADVRAELKVIISKLSPTGSYQRLEPATDRTSSSTETPVVRGKVTEYVAPPAQPRASSDEPVVAPRSKTSFIALGVGALLVVGAGLFAMTREPASAGLPAVVEPAVTKPVEVKPLEPVAPLEPVVPPEPVRPPDPVADEPLVVPGKQPVRKVPTAEQLEARVKRLRAELTRLTPPGEAPDTDADRLLGAYLLRSYAAETPALRSELEKSLNSFERDMMGPLRARAKR